MQSLDSSFEELCERIKQGRELNFVSFDPVFYLVFHPEWMLDVKKKTRSWLSKLRNAGYKVVTFSIADEIDDIFNKSPIKEFILDEEKEAGEDLITYKGTMEDLILNQDPIHERLQAKINEAATHTKGLVLITDLEALHPFTRIGVIEAKIEAGSVPVVITYPGTRSGKTSLKFLGFYPEDGNYRSVHIGG